MLEQPVVCTLNAVKAFNCLRLSQPSGDTYSPTWIDNTWFLEEVAHLTRGGRHFKPAFLEGDRPGDVVVRSTPDNGNLLYQIHPDGEEPYLTGFQFEDACFLETYLKAYAPPQIATKDVDNPNILTILNKMGFFPGMGLGKRHQGIPSFPDIPVNKCTFGLRYKHTEQEILQKVREAREKALARKEGRELPAKRMKIPLMNGRWVREGKNFPFCRYLEPWIDPVTQEKLPGLEIFFNLFPQSDDEEPKPKPEPEDWIDSMDHTAMRFLFTSTGGSVDDCIMMLTSGDNGEDLSSMFMNAPGERSSWTYEETLVEVESSKSSNSDSESSNSSISNNK
ncbi:hypothetical protein Vadar_006732 [Vaccinium darrowii]|uniref:Uncharacterized protein n=1 Tax=Vaccinium darrowii TaxID=229202 RepID=A0ACB7Z2D3_9ERIC|nr:hypothetical protein Vadar_006732 [Vaccinium darrowii]